MHFSKLSLSELLGVLAAAVLVVALLFLNWFDLGRNVESREIGTAAAFLCGKNEYHCGGFDTFPILRWILLAAAAAPFILAYIVIRGHKLSWAPGELTMVIGFAAFVLLLYNGIIDTPGMGDAQIKVTKDVGYYVALAATFGIAAAGVGRVMAAQKGPRKAPGTV